MRVLVKYKAANVPVKVMDISTYDELMMQWTGLAELIALHMAKGEELITTIGTHDSQYPEAEKNYLSVTIYDDYME